MIEPLLRNTDEQIQELKSSVERGLARVSRVTQEGLVLRSSRQTEWKKSNFTPLVKAINDNYSLHEQVQLSARQNAKKEFVLPRGSEVQFRRDKYYRYRISMYVLLRELLCSESMDPIMQLIGKTTTQRLFTGERDNLGREPVQVIENETRQQPIYKYVQCFHDNLVELINLKIIESSRGQGNA